MEALGQLTGGIAHDFNNMLGVIMGALDLVKRRIAKGDYAIERFLDAATIASERAATLTQRLLAFARQQPLSPQPLDANKMIAAMSDLLRSTLGRAYPDRDGDRRRLVDGATPIPSNSRTPSSTSPSTAATPCPTAASSRSKPRNAHLDEAYCAQNPEVKPGQFALIAMTDTGIGMSADVAARAIRSVLHHQSHRQGHRPRAEPGLRLHQAVERAHQDL